jgi:hypothetical protein
MPHTLNTQRRAEMATTSQQQAQINDLLLHITGLVRARELLQQRGANNAELEETSAEVSRLLWRLARIVQREESRHGADRRVERRRWATATR